MSSTLFSQTGGGTLTVGDPGAYTMGVQFTVNTNTTLQGIWWYSVSGAGQLPTTIALYTVSGTSLVHSETASWSGSAGSGWVYAAFSSPPSLTSGTNYKGCIFAPNASVDWYSATSHYWDTGSGGSGVTSGAITAPNNGSASSGQNSYNSGSSLAYPGSSYNATNYWVDVQVASSGGSPITLVDPPNYGLAAKNGRTHVAAVAQLTFDTTVVVDASKGNVCTLTLDSSGSTIDAPSNPAAGQLMEFHLTQGSGGSHTVSWDSAYSFGAAGAPTLSTTAGKIDVVTFRYNDDASKWLCTGTALGF